MAAIRRRRQSVWKCWRMALLLKAELLGENERLKNQIRLAREENDWLREQIAAYRDTCQSLQMIQQAHGAEAAVAIEMLRERGRNSE
jgi:hypothetical protein